MAEHIDISASGMAAMGPIPMVAALKTLKRMSSSPTQAETAQR